MPNKKKNTRTKQKKAVRSEEISLAKEASQIEIEEEEGKEEFERENPWVEK